MPGYFRLIAGGHRQPTADGGYMDFLAKKDGVRQQVKGDDNTIQVFPDVVMSDRDLTQVFKGKFVPATEAEYQETLDILANSGASQVSASDSATADLESALEGNGDESSAKGTDVSDQFDTAGVMGLKVFLKSKKYNVYLNGELQEGGSGLKKDDVKTFIDEKF